MNIHLPARDDPGYLRDDQYRDATNLDARKNLHTRFSTNQYDWFRWVFDHLDLPPEAAVLELGTGPGDLWQRNLDRIPPGWTVTLSDFSPGMLKAARATLGAAADRVRFEEIDAARIPFPDTSLDAVIANHMLYHVPNRPQALAEIRRVLKPGGRLYAATNGVNHMQAVDTLVQEVLNLPAAQWSTVSSLSFTLENGAEQLAPYFVGVERFDREDTLVVTEVEPLVAYVRSSAPRMADEPGVVDLFRRHVAAKIATDGAIRIEKSTGLFVAGV